MQLGIDQFLKNDVSKYKGKKIGLITNTTGVNKKLIPTIDLFYEHPDIHLIALFAPEHGIRRDVNEGAEIDFFIDEKTNLPVYSLYGETKKPSSHMLKNIDVLFFDLQDIGSRYYTYIYTLALAMKACEE